MLFAIIDYRHKRVLVIAPTRPLVVQNMNAKLVILKTALAVFYFLSIQSINQLYKVAFLGVVSELGVLAVWVDACTNLTILP